ncbi:MAG: type II secretion system F family protein [Bdellovibrionales bacterium]|nr:type II secretion system F family protein [Bdellovibrionales bacterium]
MNKFTFILLLLLSTSVLAQEADRNSAQDAKAILPEIVSVTPPPSKIYAIKQNVDFAVEFNEIVDVKGQPKLELIVGSTILDAPYFSGTGTTTLIFRYTVNKRDADADGISVNPAIVLDSGSIRDDDSNNSKLTFAPPPTSGIRVDGVKVDFFLNVLGRNGVLIVIGMGFFIFCYVNSIKIFSWMDEQTSGTREYILKKLEILHIEVDPQRVTWGLLLVSFGSGVFFFCVLAAIGKTALGVVVAIAATIAGWKLPRPAIDFFEEKRKKKYALQMVDALNLLANGIRAGLTMPQAIGMVVDELPAPVSQEFNLVLQQAKIGVPLDEALENLKKRVYTEDNEMFVTSVNILRETGGNLAEVFDTITVVIRERVRLQLKIDTYIASGKIQAYIIGCMPFMMILMFGSGDPDYFPLLFGTVLGIVALLVICGMVALGMFIILKIIDIKV